jgi:hypothetical protein
MYRSAPARCLAGHTSSRNRLLVNEFRLSVGGPSRFMRHRAALKPTWFWAARGRRPDLVALGDPCLAPGPAPAGLFVFPPRPSLDGRNS